MPKNMRNMYIYLPKIGVCISRHLQHPHIRVLCDRVLHGSLALLPVLPGVLGLQGYDWFLPRPFLWLCLQQATLRDEVIIPFETKRRLAYYLLWKSGLTKLSVPQLWCKVTSRTVSKRIHIKLPLWDLGARVADTHADTHAACRALSSKALCFWPQ